MARSWTPAQQAAMNTRDRTLLISAAAGSGKTATLTERIIRRLTDRDNPAELSRLLIVTFTRAAAAELKTRISDALSDAIAANPGDRHLQAQLLALPAAHICTIDSFCMEPVKAHFSEVGLPAGFRIADEAELKPLSDRVMEELIDRFYRDYAPAALPGDTVFSMLDGNDFADLCDSLSTDKSDKDLHDTLRGLYNSLMNFPAGLHRLEEEADTLEAAAEGEYFASKHGRILQTWLRCFLDSALAFYDEALSQIRQDPAAEKAWGECYEAERSFLLKLSEASQTYESVHLLLQQPELPKLKPLRSKSQRMSDIADRRKEYADYLKKKLPAFFTDVPSEMKENLKRTAVMCRVLYKFLSAYDERMTLEKRQRGICDFTDNRRNLLSLLTDKDGNPTPMAKEYRENFDEVYIDEYQDVDEVQDTIFRLVGGGHRFMVGDIKQSIYSFRGADPAVFAGYRRDLPLLNPEKPEEADPDGCCIFMSDNFRCDEPVVRVTNGVCGHLFRACPDSVDYHDEDDLGFAKRMPENAPPAASVQIDVLVNDVPRTKDGENEEDGDSVKGTGLEFIHVANRIADLLRSGACKDNGEPIRPEDIAILLRSNTHTGELIRVLQQQGIPAGSAELDAQNAGKSLLRGPDMSYLVNLLRVFDNPDTDAPLSEVLRAPFPGFSLEEVMALRAAGSGSLYDGLLACAAGHGDEALCARAKAFSEWLEDYRQRCMTLPAEGILRQMRADPKVACRRTRAFLYLYDTVRTVRAGGFTGVYAFLRFFESKLDTSKDSVSDADGKRPGFVSVMTIHKSKGLEFPVVFVVQLGARFPASDTDDLIFEKVSGVSLRLYDRAGQRKYVPGLYRAGALGCRLHEREDDMRVLYVAMTRASERLYLTGVCPTRSLPGAFPAGDRYLTLSVGNSLSWVISAFRAHPELEQYGQLCEIPFTSVAPCEPLVLTAAASLPESDAAAADMYRRMQETMPVPDPADRLLRSIPTKISASRMREGLLDDCVFVSSDLTAGDEAKLPAEEQGFGGTDVESAETVERAVSLMERAGADEFELILKADRKPTAAEKGTAAHLVLQFCDWARVVRNGLDEEIARLTGQGFIDGRTAQIADRKMLEGFFASRFFSSVSVAAEIKREFRFARFVPLRELTENEAVKQAVGNRTLYVQGSVDLICIMPDGSIVLCDYKTDKLSREEKSDMALLAAHMTEKHGAQLRQYAAAIRDIFGRAPDRVCIFSMPLGEAVEISI